MAKDKKEVKTEIQESTDVIEVDAEKEKTCFVIMPIADHPDYEKDHFDRVYEYLIKPACQAVGYQAVRADDSKASHMIMFDILKKIVECDMAICDLSTKNANVFYELGLRQAFNKKTILITDGKEKEPFDVTGFRYIKYSSSLRIDTVNKNIIDISKMLKETEQADENDINSVVSLLKIQPANIDKSKDVQLSKESTIIFNMLADINNKINKKNELTKSKYINDYYDSEKIYELTFDGNRKTLYDVLNNDIENLYKYRYYDSQMKKELGNLIKMDNSKIVFDYAQYSFNNEMTQQRIFVI